MGILKMDLFRRCASLRRQRDAESWIPESWRTRWRLCEFTQRRWNGDHGENRSRRRRGVAQCVVVPTHWREPFCRPDRATVIPTRLATPELCSSRNDAVHEHTASSPRGSSSGENGALDVAVLEMDVSDASPVERPDARTLEWKTDEQSPPGEDAFVIQTVDRLDVESNCATPSPVAAPLFKPEYSPVAAWNGGSPTASVTVLRAEVARLEALRREAERAVDRAHHQIEEQQSFALTLQRRLKAAETELEETREHKERLNAELNDLQEQLREAQGDAKDSQRRIQNLKYQLEGKEEELLERAKEIRHQRERIEHSDAEVEALKEEYLHLQVTLKRELDKIESAAAEENKRTQLLATLRKENEELRRRLEKEVELNQELRHRNDALEHSKNSRLSRELRRDDAHRLSQPTLSRNDTLHAVVRSDDGLSDSEKSQQEAALGKNRAVDQRDGVQHRQRPYSACFGEPSSRDPAQSRPERRWNAPSETSPLKWTVEEPVPSQSSTHVTMKAPYATQHSLQDVQRWTHQLEHRLMQLSLEHNQLQSEYVKMPMHSGRTLAARIRKKEVEAQMDRVAQEMSQIRFKLKYITAHLSL